MGIFSDIGDAWSKRGAIALVRELLEARAWAGAQVEPAQYARQLVQAAWREHSDAHPHRVALAAFALAAGLNELRPGDPHRALLGRALWSLISDLQRNEHRYQLSDADRRLIELAVEAYSDLVAALDAPAPLPPEV